MNVADIITQHAAQTPRAIAIADGERDIDYGLLDRAVWRAAFPLRSRRHQQVPAAAVVLRDRKAGDLVAWSRQRLGARAPRYVMQLPSLPKNAMRKVLRCQLAKTLVRRIQGKAASLPNTH